MSDSLSIIFGVVPDAISAWNPEIAPHAMVMNANGNERPGHDRAAAADELRERRHLAAPGSRRSTPTISSAIVPIFMNELR